MSFFIKACCIALKEFPAVNAQIEGEELVFSEFVDMSIAVSAPKGLVVPVIRNAEQLNFSQIEKDYSSLSTENIDFFSLQPQVSYQTFLILINHSKDKFLDFKTEDLEINL